MMAVVFWLEFIAFILVVVAVMFAVDDLNARCAYQFRQLKEFTVGAVQDAVDAIVAQLGKAKAEILSEIEVLKAAVAAGETPDLSALEAAAQALDDVVPDPVVEDPAPVEE